MIKFKFRWIIHPFHRPYLTLFMLVACLQLYSNTQAQELDKSLLARVKSLHCDTLNVRHMTVYYSPEYRGRAEELAGLSKNAAAFMEDKLKLSFNFRLAVLSPDQWFSEHPGIPYAIPWENQAEDLLFLPSSLKEGLLIRGSDEVANRRRVNFIALHEFGHLAAKYYYRPSSIGEPVPVSWLNELLATYFAFSFIQSTDSEWARAIRAEWKNEVKQYTPGTISLDWGFMNELPPNEVARTYAWYQNVLNLRAAEIHDESGFAFLQDLKKGLSWDNVDHWTNDSVLSQLESISPGFMEWANTLGSRYETRGNN